MLGRAVVLWEGVLFAVGGPLRGWHQEQRQAQRQPAMKAFGGLVPELVRAQAVAVTVVSIYCLHIN